MPDGIASDSSRIDPDSDFVDPRREHRLHRWVVRADSGSRVVVRAESNDFDAVLYAVHGDSVLYSDDEGPGSDSFLDFEMPSTQVDVFPGSYQPDVQGWYWLHVDRPDSLLLNAAGNSADTLDLLDGVGSDSSRIDPDSGFVEPIRGHRLRRWVVRADPGSRVVVRVRAESNDFDAVLYAVHGDSVLYSDDEGPGSNSFLEFEMPDSGRVDVFPGSFGPDAHGWYWLHVGRADSLLLNAAADSADPSPVFR